MEYENKTIENIREIIVNEAKMRMQEAKYQNLNSAIHEVLLQVHISVGEVMNNNK